MSTQKHDQATSLLIKHNYIVKCVINKKHEIVCEYNNVFSVKYIIDHIDKNMYDLIIQYRKDTKDEEYTQENILLPSYTLRWFVFLDILRLCRKHKLSHNIIRFFDEDGNIKDLPTLLNIDMTHEDVEKELSMSTSISDILKDSKNINKFDEAYISSGIFYEFMILKGLLV